MHRWQIKKNKIWLCNACMKDLTGIIMLGSWSWLDEVHNRTICCDRCKCNDTTVRRFGRMRRLFRFFTQNQLGVNRKIKAYRRAL